MQTRPDSRWSGASRSSRRGTHVLWDRTHREFKNNFWAIFDFQILQNGVNLLDGASVVFPAGKNTGNGDADLFNTNGDTFLQFNPASMGGTWLAHWATNQQPYIYLQTTATVDPSATLSMYMTNYDNHWPGAGYIVSATDPSGPWVIRYEWSGCNPNPNPAVRPATGFRGITNGWYIEADLTPLPSDEELTPVPKSVGLWALQETTQSWSPMGSPLQDTDDITLGDRVAMNEDGSVVAIASLGKAVDAAVSPELLNHTYSGWAPTATSGNNYWEPFWFQIKQNGTNIVHHTLLPTTSPRKISMVPVMTTPMNRCHSSITLPKTGGRTGTATSSRSCTASLVAGTTLDGSELTVRMTCRAGHWPDAGHIVSATDPAGPWTIRASWSGQLSKGNLDWVETPIQELSTVPSVPPSVRVYQHTAAGGLQPMGAAFQWPMGATPASALSGSGTRLLYGDKTTASRQPPAPSRPQRA